MGGSSPEEDKQDFYSSEHPPDPRVADQSAGDPRHHCRGAVSTLKDVTQGGCGVRTKMAERTELWQLLDPPP